MTSDRGFPQFQRRRLAPNRGVSCAGPPETKSSGAECSAIASATAPPAITALRNQTFHEALFGDQPLGFAAQDLTSIHEMVLDLQGLICRLSIALLGGTSDHIATPLGDRQRNGLELR